MKILILYQYFTTPRGRYSTRAYEFARRWVAQGAEVTVVTSQYDKSDLDSDRFLDTMEIDGITVKVVNLRVSNRQSFTVRVLTFMVFSLLSSYYALTLKSDLILCSSGPIFVGIPGLLARWFRGRPFVFEVRDLWPEGAVQLGVLKNPILIGLSRWLERLCYRYASGVVALSPDAATWISEVSGRTDICVIPNACDNDSMTAPVNGARTETSNSEVELRGIYTGSLGKMNDSFQLIRIAEALKSRGLACRIDVYGEGVDLDTIIEESDKRGLGSLVFHRGVSKDQVFDALSRSDFALLIFHGVPVLDTVSPNKMFDALAAGLPILQSTQGWIKRLLVENDCGVTVPCGDAAGFAEAIASFDQDRSQLQRMSENAKRVARAQFDRGQLSRDYMSLLTQCLGERAVV